MQRKPPRVFVQDGYFYVSVWLPGLGEKPKSTGIKADIPYEKLAPGKHRDPNWWKKSAHAGEIAAKMDIIAANRTAYLNGQPLVIHDRTDRIPSLETLLTMKAAAYERANDRPWAKTTKYTYSRAIRALKEFKKHANILTVTEDDALDFKKWMVAQRYDSETKHLFVRQLRSLWKFAIEKGFIIPRQGIAPNPWKTIVIHIEDKLKEPTDVKVEKKFFTAAYKLNRRLFDFTFWQRITGYSFADILPVTIDMRKSGYWDMRRTKTSHPHRFPESNVMCFHIEHMPQYEPMFGGYTYSQLVNNDAKEICDILGISPKLTTSSFKDSYGDELDLIVEEDRILARLMHHKVKTDSKMSSDRYLMHLKKMRHYLDHPDLEHWLTFRKNLEHDWESECRCQGIDIRVLGL